MKKILVIGANSFLATEIIRLMRAGNEITAVYHLHSDRLPMGIPAIPVSAMETLEDVFDLVFIISAYVPSGPAESDGQLLQEVNTELPARICRQFKKARIVYASSVSVYGTAPGILNEESEMYGASPYGESKLAGEEEIKKHPSYAIIRISSMYGEGMKTGTFLPAIIASALKSGSICLLGEGSRMQNYIHVSDVAKFFEKAAGHYSNNTYLAVAEKSISNHEIAFFIQQQLPDIKIVMQGIDGSPSFYYDATATYKMLDLKPQKNIQEGISELIKWQQKKF